MTLAPLTIVCLLALAGCAGFILSSNPRQITRACAWSVIAAGAIMFFLSYLAYLVAVCTMVVMSALFGYAVHPNWVGAVVGVICCPLLNWGIPVAAMVGGASFATCFFDAAMCWGPWIAAQILGWVALLLFSLGSMIDDKAKQGEG